MQVKILVTGGFGYLGGRVTDFLSHQGLTCRLGTRSSQRRCHWLQESEVCQTDFDDAASLRDACSGIEAVLHLAGPDALSCQNNEKAARQAACTGTQRLLEAAVSQGVKRFINLSTAHVYGQPLQGHLHEEKQPQPAHPYGAIHWERELVVAGFKGAIEVLNIRLSNCFGAPQDPEISQWGLLVNNLCRQAIVDHKLMLQSPGHQLRDFITLTDTCRALFHFINMPSQATAPITFNLGGGHTESILGMAGRVANCYAQIFHKKIPIRRPESTHGRPQHELIYDITRLQESGFKLQSHIPEEITDCLQFCYSNFQR